MISVPNESDDIGRGPRVMILDADFPIWENCVYELPDEVPAEKKDEMLILGNSYRASVVLYDDEYVEIDGGVRRDNCEVSVIVSYSADEKGTLSVQSTIFTEELTDEETHDCFILLMKSFCEDVDFGEYERVSLTYSEALLGWITNLKHLGFKITLRRCDNYKDFDGKWSDHEYLCTYSPQPLE